MLNKFKQISLVALFLFGLLFSIQQVLAAPPADVNAGLNDTLGSIGDTNKNALTNNSDIKVIAGKAIGGVLAFVGVIFFVLMIYGGFLWMTASGNDTQTAKAKELIVAAVIGLIIVLSAYAITSYLGTQLTS